jgi:hypothetical protein
VLTFGIYRNPRIVNDITHVPQAHGFFFIFMFLRIVSLAALAFAIPNQDAYAEYLYDISKGDGIQREWALPLIKELLSSKATDDIPFFSVPEIDFQTIPRISYEDLRGRIGTGDVVLFSGLDGIGTFLRRFTVSPYSHVAVAFKNETGPTIFHSNVIPFYDVMRHDTTNGTQLNPYEYLKAYKDGWVIWRPIVIEDSRLPWVNEQFLKAIKSWTGRPFPPYGEIIPNYIRGLLGFPKEPRDGDRVCTEVVAEAYQEAGLLMYNTTPHSYTPGDFSELRTKLEDSAFKVSWGKDHLVVIEGVKHPGELVFE